MITNRKREKLNIKIIKVNSEAQARKRAAHLRSSEKMEQNSN